MARRSRRRLAAWLALPALLVFGVVLALGWLVMVYPEQHGPGDGRTVEIEVRPDAGLAFVSRSLSESGVLADPRTFQLYAWLRGAGGRLEPGTHLVTDAMTPRELLTRVARGFGHSALRITVPEGFTRFDVARRLERWGVCDAQAFLAATEAPELLEELGIRAPTAEGYLFPDTYQLRDGRDPEAVVRRLFRNFRRRVGPLLLEHEAGLSDLRRDLGFGLWQVVTLASIVEKEAVVPEEQPVIAGVFLNRLRSESFQPKRLQADPTVSYGCLVAPALASCAGFDGRRITRAMLADPKNLYNTYRHDGLPPGPVANPGLSALRSVLSPSRHDYLYFVASGGGRHRFSATLEDHARAVDRYREGRP